MSLKDELEVLRGASMKVCVGDPLDIPCIETSDSDRLCKHPVVSVHMITYNHEPYIRRAIEGVMMQKTDFEFELVIGEDCSTDRTREICFECQKRYPDKIRVLWWHENLRRVNHPAGCNGARNRAHLRGEFFAICEGDDYWIDPLKLQKQVDEMRRTDAVMCLADSEWHCANGTVQSRKYGDAPKLLSALEIWNYYFHTSTIVMRRDVYRKCTGETYKEFPYWYDHVVEVCMATMGPVCYLPDVVSVYNWTGNGDGGSEGSWKRFVLMLTQFVELYLWGPTELKNTVATCILSMLQTSNEAKKELLASGDPKGKQKLCAAMRMRRRLAYETCGMKGFVLSEWRSLTNRYSSCYRKHPLFQMFWRKFKRMLGR